MSLATLMKNSVDLTKQVATIEGGFALKPNRIQQNHQSVPVDLQPTVGVAVTLRREEADTEVYEWHKSVFQWVWKTDWLGLI